MLNFLRQKKENILIKIVLAVIILSFAAFFGASSLSPGARRAGSPGSVNGQELNATFFAFVLNNKLESARSKLGGKLPEQYVTFIKQDVLSELVDRELLVQNLQKMGLSASPDEVATFVKEDPLARSPRDGRFNLTYYKNSFLPGYRQRRGKSYESDVINQLTAQKFFSEFNNVIKPNKQELERELRLKDTKYKFAVIKVSKKEAPPKKDQNEKDQKEKDQDEKDIKKTKVSAKEKAQKIYDLWTQNKDIKKLLDEYKLKERKTPDLNYARLKSVFGGKVDTKNIKTLLSLSKKNPFPKSYIDEGNFLYLIKLEDIKEPETTIKKEEYSQLQESYQENITNNLVSAYIIDLRDKADIEIYK